ncbi:MAG: hypothetical protein L0229_00800 [Blastocatellia bacterium]|nr:hypothetical protein [Blastocatellia bacterium]
MTTFTIIEPMSTGDVIDRAVRLYRRNFSPLVTIVAVPSLIGYISSMMFWFGLGELEAAATPGASASAGAVGMLMLVVGGMGYPVSMFVLLLTISGLARVIGDQLMLSETITFRKCVKAVRRRLGDITVLAFLCMAILTAMYIIFSIIVFALIMVVGVLAGITSALSLPPWVVATLMVIASVAAIAVGLAAMLLMVSRVVFLPQIVMIEGQTAGAALGRAISLGKGNWYKVGGIALFSYFVSLSLLAAFTLPVMGILYLFGLASAEFLLSPTWNIIYTAFNQITNLLVLPIWVVSFTLLYFDSRVRKEAYDVELMARELSPGFYWQPIAPAQSGPFGYQVPTPPVRGRVYVQTSPLGLAGYRPPPPPPRTVGPVAPDPTSQDLWQKFNQAATSLGGAGESLAPPATNQNPPGSMDGERAAQAPPRSPATCRQCRMPLEHEARFCMRCGSPTEEVAGA